MNRLKLPWRAENGCVVNALGETVAACVIETVLRNDPEMDHRTAQFIAKRAGDPIQGTEIDITVRGYDMTAYVDRYDHEDNDLVLSALMYNGQDLMPSWELIDPHIRAEIEVLVIRGLGY